MSATRPPFQNPDDLADALRADESVDRRAAAVDAASWPQAERSRLIENLLTDGTGRRWLRGHLLPLLPEDEAGQLAERLLAWPEDFVITRRDRTTLDAVRRLPNPVLHREAPYLAGSNAASALWDRLSRDDPETVADITLRIMHEGSRAARETTIHSLLIDPMSPVPLNDDQINRLLITALNDPDEEVRGLAADLLAEQDSPHLLGDLDRWVRDPGERVRMAAWDTALATDFERATEQAADLIADETAPLPARRSALIALGNTLTTHEIAPILTTLVQHPERELAEDAANLLWAYHRTPAVAEAASRSPHSTVREVGERLLHPEIGSPAAGGSRPGAPNSHRDIYREMLRGLEDRTVTGEQADSTGDTKRESDV